MNIHVNETRDSSRALTACSLYLDQAFSQSDDHGVGATVCAQFLHDFVHVTFHSAFADPQYNRNFLVRLACCDAAQDGKLLFS